MPPELVFRHGDSLLRLGMECGSPSPDESSRVEALFCWRFAIRGRVGVYSCDRRVTPRLKISDDLRVPVTQRWIARVVNSEVYKPLTSVLVHLRAAGHAGRIVQRCRPRSPACPDHRQAAIVTVSVVSPGHSVGSC